MYSTGSRGSKYMVGSSRSSSVVKGDLIIMHDNGIPFSVLTAVEDPIGT